MVLMHAHVERTIVKLGRAISGRTLDWFVSDMDTKMWLDSRMLERTNNTKTCPQWKNNDSRVVTASYEGAATRWQSGYRGRSDRKFNPAEPFKFLALH